MLDLGDRRHRILRVLGDLLSGRRHARLPHGSLKSPHTKEVVIMASVLFSPITMRGLTLPNRVVVSPMCQYNSNDGSANDWHLMHLGNMSLGAAGLVMCEMTNVNSQGRISPKCAGMYSDENEAALKRVHDFCRQYGVAKLGVQLAHAGRKAPTTPPAAGGKPILEGPDAWTPEAPSAIPYDTGWAMPHAMTKTTLSASSASSPLPQNVSTASAMT